MLRLRLHPAWSGLIASLLVLLACAAYLAHAQRQQDLSIAKETAERELALLTSLVRHDLTQGDYQHANSLLQDWGSNKGNVAELHLQAGNGFLISSFQRPVPVERTLRLESRVSYSYAGEASLHLARDLTPVLERSQVFMLQLGVAYLVLAMLLTALTYILLLYRKESITLHQQSQALHQSLGALKRTQFSLDHAPDGVFWLNKDGAVTYVNEQGARLIGYRPDELIGKFIWDFDPDFPPEAWPKLWRDLHDGKLRSFETRHMDRQGNSYPVEITTIQTRYDGEILHAAFVRDISERKRE